jgi:nicotinamidase-related amidase
VIVKHKPNSFAGTELENLLRALGVTELHLAGAMTNMCVDSTARAAFDLGYAVVVHGHACAARSLLGTRLIHRLFLANLGSTFARIV